MFSLPRLTTLLVVSCVPGWYFPIRVMHYHHIPEGARCQLSTKQSGVQLATRVRQTAKCGGFERRSLVLFEHSGTSERLFLAKGCKMSSMLELLSD